MSSPANQGSVPSSSAKITIVFIPNLTVADSLPNEAGYEETSPGSVTSWKGFVFHAPLSMNAVIAVIYD